MTRIKTKKVNISNRNIKNFFKGRVNKLGINPITSVLYQDAHPEIAKMRDLYEKKFVLNKIKFNETDIVLDLGCGIGRWADVLKDKVKQYIGTDYIKEFIDYAKERYKTNKNLKFIYCSAQNTTWDKLKIKNKFSKVIIAGLFIYLNDDEVIQVAENIKELSSENTIIYLREPCGIDTRLTLDNIWSDELNQNYNAIYRTRKELLTLILKVLDNYEIIFEGDLYNDNSLNNRQDTKQQVVILKLK